MLTLQDIMLPTELGKFQKLQQSYMASVRAKAKAENKWVTGRSASLLRGNVKIDQDRLLFNFEGANSPQFQQLETGRKGGKVPQGFKNIIYEWSKQRGISFADDKERKTFAYLTARKIANEGTSQYRNNQRKDIFSTLYKRFTDNVDKYINEWLEYACRREIDRINNSISNR